MGSIHDSVIQSIIRGAQDRETSKMENGSLRTISQIAVRVILSWLPKLQHDNKINKQNEFSVMKSMGYANLQRSNVLSQCVAMFQEKANSCFKQICTELNASRFCSPYYVTFYIYVANWLE